MASRHDEFLTSGGRLFGIVVDSPQRNSAMIEKLSLPFPILSDPDRAQAITPYGVAHPTDHRNIAIPAIVIVSPAGQEAWRWESRDYADRVPEDVVLEALAALALPPTSQAPPATSNPEPGPRAMPFDQLGAYLRGARFAAAAMATRHPSVSEDAALYVEEMDRFLEALRILKLRRSPSETG